MEVPLLRSLRCCDVTSPWGTPSVWWISEALIPSCQFIGQVALGSCVFKAGILLYPKKDGGLRPILDLRRLNLELTVNKFKMLTIKSILSQIQPQDWFVTIDLKDAYFHIQIVKRHRKFLQFAFEGKAYQYCVPPFGLALVPRMFTKCMDAALAPLRLRASKYMIT